MIEIMSKEAAIERIKVDKNVIFLDHIIGRLYSVIFSYNPDLSKVFRSEIPSFQWVDSHKFYKIHFFDINRFVELANQLGYFVIYSQSAFNSFKTNKSILEELNKLKETIIMNIPYTKRQLKDYQIIGTQFMYYARTAINADAPGAGKTIQSVGAILLNKYASRPYKTIIVVPNSVKYNWKNEFDLTTDELKVMIMDSNYHKRQEQYQQSSNYDVLIMSYDSFMKDYEDIPTIFDPNIFIVDEAHRLANRTNKITQIIIGSKTIKKNFLKLCKNLHSIYLLTGTPFINKIEDIYPLLRIVDNGIYTLDGFRNRYMKIKECEKVVIKDGIVKRMKFPLVLGYRNEEELKKRLNFYMIRRTKDKIINELPPVSFKTIEIELSKEERMIYNQLRDEFRKNINPIVIMKGNISINNPELLRWFTKAQLICDSLELVEEANSKKSSKKEELIDIIKDRIEDNKIVIFSKYKKMIDILERDLKEYNPLLLHGEIKDVDRQKNIEAFQNDSNKRLFLATLGAGGLGVNLTTGDKDNVIVILYDRWYSAALNNQAISRVYRLGQNKPIEVIIMRVKDSIEERIERIWINKEITASNLVDDEAIFKMLSFEQLMELI
jgi:SNF2 family DNA or RNA helicase